MKILFVWTGVTSYMTDCWRALQARPEVELKIVIDDVRSGRDFDKVATLRGLDWRLNDLEGTWTPDVVFVVGWHSQIVRSFVSRPDWRHVPKVFCMDMPWRWRLRCFAARFVLRSYLRQFKLALVPGAFAARYARWLGFKTVRTGMFSISQARFRNPEGTPLEGNFLYVGRFSSEKRLDVLLAGYEKYRAMGGVLGLDLYGSGELPASHRSHPLYAVHPFVQAADVPALYRSHRALVLASDFDPWPLVVLEACTAGCPVVISDKCTNHGELVRTPDAGIVYKTGDVEALARALLEIEARGGVRRYDGDLARYDVSAWCDRVLGICGELHGGRG